MATTGADADLYSVALWNSGTGAWEPVTIQGSTFTAGGDVRRFVSSTGDIRVRFTDSARGERNEPADTLSIDLLYVEISQQAASNQGPVAHAQSLATLEDTTLSLILTGSDAEGDPMTYAVVSGPSHGTLTGAPPNLSYTPSRDYHGSDSFAFKANDGRTDSAPAPVGITITPVNDPPSVQEKTVKTPKGKPIKIELSATDPDGDPLTFEVVGDPSHGTLTGTAPDLTYAPLAEYVGLDQFIFVASDGQLDSGTAPVSITIEDGPVEVRITNAQVTDYGVIVSWASTAGVTYRLDYKANLTDSTWLPLSEMVGAIGGTTSYADRLAEQGIHRRYYRVEQVE